MYNSNQHTDVVTANEIELNSQLFLFYSQPQWKFQTITISSF